MVTFLPVYGFIEEIGATLYDASTNLTVNSGTDGVDIV